MLRLKFGHIAILFGTTGIALLYVVTVLSQPIAVSDLSKLDEFEGQVISVDGTVLSYKTTDNGETVYTIYNNKQTLDVLVEFGSPDEKISRVNFIMKVSGEVQKDYRGNYQLVVTDSKNLEFTGLSEPDLLSWDNIEDCNNSYVRITGTITHIEEYYGEKQKLILRNGMEKIELIMPHGEISISIGSNIEADGIIRESYGSYRVYIYSTDHFRITGQWEIETIGLEDLMGEPERYVDFPIYLQGVVRYEPYSEPASSFYLSSSPIDSSISIRVELVDFETAVVLHKSDSVSMLAYTSFDPYTLRYCLSPIELEITHNFGKWSLTLDDLTENIIEFERAEINLSGYLYINNNTFLMGNRAVLENCSVQLKIGYEEEPARSDGLSYTYLQNYFKDEKYLQADHNQGIKTAILGSLISRPEHLDYIFTLKAEPDSYFNGSQVLE